jgi:hypothetical protein
VCLDDVVGKVLLFSHASPLSCHLCHHLQNRVNVNISQPFFLCVSTYISCTVCPFFKKNVKEKKMTSNIFLKNVAFWASESISKYFYHGNFDPHKMITAAMASLSTRNTGSSLYAFFIMKPLIWKHFYTFHHLALSTLRIKIFLHLSLSSFSRLSDIIWFLPWRETEGCSSRRWGGVQNSSPECPFKQHHSSYSYESTDYQYILCDPRFEQIKKRCGCLLRYYKLPYSE